MGEAVTVDDGMQIVFDRAAGVDIGKKELAACVRVPDGRGKYRSQTKTFATTTGVLLELSDWLRSQRVQVVAMEATGAYWKPVFYLLEDSFVTRLVNPRDVRQVKGRKPTSRMRCGWPSSSNMTWCGPVSCHRRRSATSGS